MKIHNKIIRLSELKNNTYIYKKFLHNYINSYKIQFLHYLKQNKYIYRNIYNDNRKNKYKYKLFIKYYIKFIININFNIPNSNFIKKILEKEKKQILQLKNINQKLIKRLQLLKLFNNWKKNKLQIIKKKKLQILLNNNEKNYLNKSLELKIQKTNQFINKTNQNQQIIKNFLQDFIFKYTKIIRYKHIKKLTKIRKLNLNVVLIKKKKIKKPIKPVFWVAPRIWRKMNYFSKQKHKKDKEKYKILIRLFTKQKSSLLLFKKRNTKEKKKNRKINFYKYMNSFYNSYWIGRLVNMFTLNGEKKKVFNLIQKSILFLKYKYAESILSILYKILESAKPLFRIRKRIKRKKFIEYPVLVKNTRSYLSALQWVKYEIKNTLKREINIKFFLLVFNKLVEIISLPEVNKKLKKHEIYKTRDLSTFSAVRNQKYIRFGWKKKIK